MLALVVEPPDRKIKKPAPKPKPPVGRQTRGEAAGGSTIQAAHSTAPRPSRLRGETGRCPASITGFKGALAAATFVCGPSPSVSEPASTPPRPPHKANRMHTATLGIGPRRSAGPRRSRSGECRFKPLPRQATKQAAPAAQQGAASKAARPRAKGATQPARPAAAHRDRTCRS